MGWPYQDAVNTATRNIFGSEVEYRPASGGAVELTAVFDEAYLTVQIQDGVEIASSRPVLDVRLADLDAAPAPDDELTVDGRNWRVVEIDADGRGAAKLWLHRVSS